MHQQSYYYFYILSELIILSKQSMQISSASVRDLKSNNKNLLSIFIFFCLRE